MINIASKIILSVAVIYSIGCNQDNNSKKASIDAIHNDASADSSNNTSNGMPAITWVKTMHDFGKITQGEKAEYSFKFTNTGNGQLLISGAVASCGCTVPEYPKEPINPGEDGFIKITFDSDKRLDKFEKSVTITSNANPVETTLIITGMVIPTPEEQYKMLHE